MTGNIGTVSWTAPEVLNNVRYHFAADIYSFGMILFEMVSGELICACWYHLAGTLTGLIKVIASHNVLMMVLISCSITELVLLLR